MGTYSGALGGSIIGSMERVPFREHCFGRIIGNMVWEHYVGAWKRAYSDSLCGNVGAEKRSRLSRSAVFWGAGVGQWIPALGIFRRKSANQPRLAVLIFGP